MQCKYIADDSRMAQGRVWHKVACRVCKQGGEEEVVGVNVSARQATDD